MSAERELRKWECYPYFGCKMAMREKKTDGNGIDKEEITNGNNIGTVLFNSSGNYESMFDTNRDDREYIYIYIRAGRFWNCKKKAFIKSCKIMSKVTTLAVRVFANGPGDLGSIPGEVIPKTQKMVLDASLLNSQHYKVRIKGKVEQSWEGIEPSPTPWCSSYQKGSLRVTLDYVRQLYFTYIFLQKFVFIWGTNLKDQIIWDIYQGIGVTGNTSRLNKTQDLTKIK